MTTFRYTPATNVCSDVVCTSFVANADSAMACSNYGDFTQGGWPAAGGQVSIQFWGAPCPPSTIPSLNMCFQSALNLAWCAPPPNVGENYDPYKFVTNYGYFSTPSSIQGTNAQLRWHAILADATQTALTVEIYIEVLDQVDGQNVWVDWYSGTFTLPIVGTYARNQGNAFKSSPEYIPITVTNPNCEVKFMSINAGLQPLRMGCGTGQNDFTCGLYDGNDYITCARGMLQDKTGPTLPTPFLFGLNGSNCTTTSSCGCDLCEVTSSGIGYTCLFNSDAAFKKYVLTNFNEPIGDQQSIQVATGSLFPIMLKLVGGVRYVYWCPTGDTNTWERTPFNIVQTNKPTIVVAEDSRWKITVYFTRFPSAELLPNCDEILPNSAPQMVEAAPVAATAPKAATMQELIQQRVSGKRGCCGAPIQHNWTPNK